MGTGGYYRWGWVDSTPAQVASLARSVRVRLAIYPPGVTRADRTLLAIYGMRNTWVGVIIATGLAVVGGILLGSILWGAILSLGVYVTVWAITAARTRKFHARIRYVRASVTSNSDSGLDRLAQLAWQLDELDAQDYSPVEYELEWGRIYDQAGSL